MDRATVDPTAWRDVCDGLAGLVGAAGTGFVPLRVQARAPGCPYSESIEDLAQRYFADWTDRDTRGDRGFPVILANGIGTDQDFFREDEIRESPFYNELLAPIGYKWCLALSFQVNNDIWAAVLQGRLDDAPFGNAARERILKVRQQLTIAATRAAMSGFDRAEDWKAALEAGGRAVLGLDDLGRVLAISPAAEALLGGELQVRAGNLCCADPRVQRRLSDLVSAAVRYDPFRSTPIPSPISVRRLSGRTLHIDALPLPRDYQTIVTRIVALLLLRETDDSGASLSAVLSRQFGLTAAEVRLALLLAEGLGLQEASERCRIRHSTARAQLRSIFAKTDTHRQGELIALIARLV